MNKLIIIGLNKKKNHIPKTIKILKINLKLKKDSHFEINRVLILNKNIYV